MIFSDDRDKIIKILFRAIKTLKSLDYNKKDYYSLKDISDYITNNMDNKDNSQLISMHTIYNYYCVNVNNDLLKVI